MLPSVLVITAEHLATLEAYLKQGGKPLITGETGAFTGPSALLLPRNEDIMSPLARAFPGQVTLVKARPGLAYHGAHSNSAALQEALTRSSDHLPVVAASNPPGHIGIYANKSLAPPGGFTIDLVNYNHDLATDHITPVTRTDFTVTLQGASLKNTAHLKVESIRYDETAPSNTLRQVLDTERSTVSGGSLTLRIPPFTHYQVLRIWTSKP